MCARINGEMPASAGQLSSRPLGRTTRNAPGHQRRSRAARVCRMKKGSGMASLVFGMNQSLDGYVDHMAFAPSPTLFRHFIEGAQGQAGRVYGRHMYEVMRYWDDDHPEWDA